LDKTELRFYNWIIDLLFENRVVEKKKMQSRCFKTCPMCGFVWPEKASFLNDPTLKIVGYQVNFDEPMGGLFLFHHICGTSLAIKAEAFQDLYDGPMFTERMMGTKECGGNCLHKDDLRSCPVKCECAYVREIMQVVLNWPKQGSAMKQQKGERTE
jgi:hypothetical protein